MNMLYKSTATPIIGHAKIREDIRRLILNDRLPHALLFVGDEGIGKKLIARELARGVLCNLNFSNNCGYDDAQAGDVKKREGVPCDSCRSCYDMNKLQHPDYIEVTAELRGKATRIIRMEQIRGLISSLSHSPLAGSKRVVVIDEAETLGEIPANSILKTIEEPSGETIFILITSRVEAILATIRSRCTTLNFGQLSVGEIREYLQAKMADEANFQAGANALPASLELIARLANGSLARALALSSDNEALSMRDKALAILFELPTMRMERIWELSGELGKLSRSSSDQMARFFLMGIRDLRLIGLQAKSPLLINVDKEMQLHTLREQLSDDRLFRMQSIIEDFANRVGSNANLTLQLEGVLIRLRESIV